MSGKRYPREFKKEVIKMVIIHGVPVAQVAARLGVTSRSVYHWINTFGPAVTELQLDAQAEIQRLKKALKRVTEERDCLKESIAFYTQQFD